MIDKMYFWHKISPYNRAFQHTFFNCFSLINFFFEGNVVIVSRMSWYLRSHWTNRTYWTRLASRSPVSSVPLTRKHNKNILWKKFCVLMILQMRLTNKKTRKKFTSYLHSRWTSTRSPVRSSWPRQANISLQPALRIMKTMKKFQKWWDI